MLILLSNNSSVKMKVLKPFQLSRRATLDQELSFNILAEAIGHKMRAAATATPATPRCIYPMLWRQPGPHQTVFEETNNGWYKIRVNIVGSETLFSRYITKLTQNDYFP